MFWIFVLLKGEFFSLMHKSNGIEMSLQNRMILFFFHHSLDLNQVCNVVSLKTYQIFHLTSPTIMLNCWNNTFFIQSFSWISFHIYFPLITKMFKFGLIQLTLFQYLYLFQFKMGVVQFKMGIVQFKIKLTIPILNWKRYSSYAFLP